MPSGNNLIETGVDKLVDIVKQKKRLSLQDAAKELGVSQRVVEEWADFLEEEGIISVEYRFANAFLVERKLTQEQIQEKEKEFHGKKEGFVRKVESVLSQVEKETDVLIRFRKGFEKFKKSLGNEPKNVLSELITLEKYEVLKEEIEADIAVLEKEFAEKIDFFEKELDKERQKFKEFINMIKGEESKFEKLKGSPNLREKEEYMKKKLEIFEGEIKKIAQLIKDEEVIISKSDRRIIDIKIKANNIKKEIQSKGNNRDKLHEKRNEYEEKISELKNKVLEKISKDKARKASVDFNKLIEEKTKVENILKDIGKQRAILETEILSASQKKGLGKAAGGDVKDILDKIGEANEALIGQDLNKVKELYLEIMSVYNKINPDDKKRVYPAIKELYEYRKKVLEKISSGDAQNASVNFDKLFEKSGQVEKILKDMDNQKAILETEFRDLLKKANELSVSSKSSDIQEQIKQLESKYNEINKSKEQFEQEVSELNSLLKDN